MGTPRAITRPADNAKVCEWKNDEPFGANAPTENPSGLGAFTYNLRFPGQFYDQETDTHSNAFSPAWLATGGTSTLTFTMTSPSGMALTSANFTDLFTNMTVASTTIGGTCAGTTNSPALTTGATGVNLTVPTLPAGGCTITVQVTSATLGANGNVTSAVTSTETTDAGVASNTAYLTVNPADVGFLYVHPDHLGTPRAITRPSDNQVVWKWDNVEPFGNNAPNENPSGLGTLAYNLRHPGQYADVETGTFYNWNRDYDSATGRYAQSDPIGLIGGINTYAYVKGNPLWFTDPEGLEAKDYRDPLIACKAIGRIPKPDKCIDETKCFEIAKEQLAKCSVTGWSGLFNAGKKVAYITCWRYIQTQCPALTNECVVGCRQISQGAA